MEEESSEAGPAPSPVTVVGELAVFTGAWLTCPYNTGPDIVYTTGFTGVLVEARRLGAVFDVTRTVAEQLCDAQEGMRVLYDEQVWLHGTRNTRPADLWEDPKAPYLAFRSDDLVYGVEHDSGFHTFETLEHTPDGLYRIDLPWPWIITNPARCTYLYT